MPIGRTLNTYSVGVKFVADEDSTMLLAIGATVNIAAFTDPKYGTAGKRFIPAGTAVVITAGLVVPTDNVKTTYLTASDIVENPLFYRGSDDTTGLYAGGIFFEDRLPDAVSNLLPAATKTAMGSNFVFIQSPGLMVVGN